MPWWSFRATRRPMTSATSLAAAFGTLSLGETISPSLAGRGQDQRGLVDDRTPGALLQGACSDHKTRGELASQACCQPTEKLLPSAPREEGCAFTTEAAVTMTI